MKVTVDVPEEPGAKLKLVGDAETVKSGGGETVTAMLVEWVRLPLVPVIVTVYVPGVDEVKVAVEVPLPLGIEVELSVTVSPTEGVTVEVRPTVELNPFAGEIVTVADADEPETKDTVGGAEIEKSGDGAVTVIVMGTSWTRLPAVPTTPP